MDIEGIQDNPVYRAWEYCHGFTARAERLAETAAHWAQPDIARERGVEAWQQQSQSRELLLYRTAVEVGFQLVDLGRSGFLRRLPRIQTRIFQVDKELCTAFRRFRVQLDWHTFGPTYGFDRYLALAFEETCRLLPLPEKRPANKKWGTRYTYACEVHRAKIYTAALRALSSEVLKAVAEN